MVFQQGTDNIFEGPGTYKWLVIDTLMKMRDSKAADDLKKYWHYFQFVLQLMSSHIEAEERRRIQADFNVLDQRIAGIKERVRAGTLNKQASELEIAEERAAFAEAKEYYIMMAIPKAGLTKNEDDAIIEFGEGNPTIDQVAQIVRDGQHGVPGNIRRVLGNAK